MSKRDKRHDEDVEDCKELALFVGGIGVVLSLPLRSIWGCPSLPRCYGCLDASDLGRWAYSRRCGSARCR